VTFDLSTLHLHLLELNFGLSIVLILPRSIATSSKADKYPAESRTARRRPDFPDCRTTLLCDPPSLAMSSQPVTHLYRSLLRELRLAVSPAHGLHIHPIKILSDAF
jgi:hypothetical protein